MAKNKKKTKPTTHRLTETLKQKRGSIHQEHGGTEEHSNTRQLQHGRRTARWDSRLWAGCGGKPLGLLLRMWSRVKHVGRQRRKFDVARRLSAAPSPETRREIDKKSIIDMSSWHLKPGNLFSAESSLRLIVTKLLFCLVVLVKVIIWEHVDITGTTTQETICIFCFFTAATGDSSSLFADTDGGTGSWGHRYVFEPPQMTEEGYESWSWWCLIFE